VNIDYVVQPDKYGSYIFTAVLKVNLALPSLYAPRTKRFEAIIDSGASRCMFHSDFAKHIGLDLKAGALEQTQGIGGSTDSWLHEVFLYVPGGPVKIHASFKEGLPVAGLLGMNGFFEHFIVTFMHPALACEIERIVQHQA
jgi:hypothetical protein